MLKKQVPGFANKEEIKDRRPGKPVRLWEPDTGQAKKWVNHEKFSGSLQGGGDLQRGVSRKVLARLPWLLPLIKMK